MNLLSLLRCRSLLPFGGLLCVGLWVCTSERSAVEYWEERAFAPPLNSDPYSRRRSPAPIAADRREGQTLGNPDFL